jgi:Holliday junction resolvasome RuvABC endonuclease subunit
MNKKNSITSLGLDLSLCGSGVVILTDGVIIRKELVKSKPVSNGTPLDELKRLDKIVYDIQNIIKGTMIHIAVIENLAFGVRNATSLTQLAGLSYFIRKMLYENQIPFILVAPPSLKKFITGSGGAKKDEMLLSVFKRYGVTILDDNICDAYSLSQVGLCLLDGNSKSITSFQQEVLLLLKKQL